jgi:ethanolamine ammonia-lyase small subunit
MSHSKPNPRHVDDVVVDSIVEAVLQQIQSGRGPSFGGARGDALNVAASDGMQGGESCTPAARPIHAVERALDESQLATLVSKTPSRIAMGRAGCRLRTDDYLRTREGHADARDAVHSEVPPEWPARLGLLSLRTQCRDRNHYLLYPNSGRRLCDESKAALAPHISAAPGPGPDVQLIVGDGLSPNAIVQNGEATVLAMQQALTAAGWKLGVSCFVRFARIGVADEIGVLTRARASVILVGERPGLGTGDSLSVYIAIGPKLGQDNAEKNCISNVRPIGIRPEEAAAQTAMILQRGFERGVGGVALGLGWGRR